MIRVYLVILPVDVDGAADLETRTFIGTYEETADPIVAFVDEHVDRGVDGMALEAWLVTGDVGTDHIVMDVDKERQVCVIVRLAVPS